MVENGKAVDIEQTKKMVDTFIEQGFNYFDTAHGYLEGKSASLRKQSFLRLSDIRPIR